MEVIRKKIYLTNREDVPKSIIKALSLDKIQFVRMHVAKNTKYEDILHFLSKDKPFVRLQVARNIHSSLKTLQRLTFDDDTEVRLAALKNLGEKTEELYNQMNACDWGY